MTPVKTELTHRQRQALETKRIIAEAAKALFLEQGYAATSIEAVASRAGVAVSTVYSIYKNKRSLLKGIRATWFSTSQAGDIYEMAAREDSLARRLELYAHATRRQWETGSAMLSIYTSAASADPEAAAELQATLESRRQRNGEILQEAAHLFRQDLRLEQITAIYVALTRPELFQELTDAWKWSPDEYEVWLANTLKQQFLP